MCMSVKPFAYFDLYVFSLEVYLLELVILWVCAFYNPHVSRVQYFGVDHFI